MARAMSEVREILRRSDIESLRKEFGSEYVISELMWHVLMELTVYAQVKPGAQFRDDDRGINSFKWDLEIQSRLIECLRTIHNHQAEKQIYGLLRVAKSLSDKISK